MRILFVTATRVGDAILSTGLLDHLIRQNPGARITIACGPPAASLFSAVPGLERLVVLDKMVLSLHWFGLWAACVGKRWDILVDLRNAPITYLLAAKRHYRIGRSRRDEHRLIRLARVLGLEAEPPSPRVWTGPQEHERAARLVPEGPPVLAVGPTANWIGKTWRPERFAELIEQLTGPGGILPGARVAVFGRDDERPQALPVIEAIPESRRIDLVLGLDLVTVHACLARAAFYVGNDSGLMHLAASTGVPTLGLFGPSQEKHYAPWGGHCATVRTEQSYETLFPSGFDHRTTGTLMDGLSVDAAAAAAHRLWNRINGVASCASPVAQDRRGHGVNKPVLSALVTVRNEEARLPGCLAALAFADEIVVLLDRCTDTSKAVAECHGARTLEGAWEREGDRRNAGIAACRGAWVLEVDADETVPDDLAREIRRTVETSTYDWHEIPVDNHIGKRLVRWGWGASYGKAAYPGLFRRGTKIWGPQRVHPTLAWNGRKGPMLKARLRHDVDRNISDMIRRLDSYSTARARDLRESGDFGSLGGNVRRFMARFLKSYVSRKGYREGGHGLLVAIFTGLYPLISYLKARHEDD